MMVIRLWVETDDDIIGVLLMVLHSVSHKNDVGVVKGFIVFVTHLDERSVSSRFMML